MKEMKTWSNCSQKEQIERWENAARVLQNLTPHEKRKHFNMFDWAVKTDCGTVACAAGHCGFDPWFNRRGFKLKFVKEEYMDSEYNPKTSQFKDVKIIDWNLVPAMNDRDIPNYVIAFFGYGGTQQIFLNGRPRSVSNVIKEIKEHIQVLKKDHLNMVEPY